MQLDSGQFVLFLALAWVVWRILPKAASPYVLLAASILFYASSNLAHLGLLIFAAGVNYIAARKLTVWSGDRKRAVLFTVAIVFDVGLLVFYKWASVYLNLHSAPPAVRSLIPSSTADIVIFPLGLSFFTFQMVSCVTDVYRRNYQWNSGAVSFFLFAFFFPQISAGPIPRAGDLVPQLTKPPHVLPEDLETGISLFVYGLFKKLVIANRLQDFAGHVFATDLRTGSITVLLACVFSSLALYADFSGYTDMARGAGRAFGIHLAENFNYPFLAESVTDFWRRWHMTLSNWLKDYLYMPLVIRLRGFGKVGVVFTFLFTFLVCGLWHRLSWTLAIFGLLHGTALSVEFLTRKIRQSWMKKWRWLNSAWVGRSYVFIFYVAANVMFSASSVSQALKIYASILIPRRLSGFAELFGYSGPVLFVLIFVSLALWCLVVALHTKWKERSPARLVLVCAMITLILGKLSEGGFVYVAF